MGGRQADMVTRPGVIGLTKFRRLLLPTLENGITKLVKL